MHRRFAEKIPRPEARQGGFGGGGVENGGNVCTRRIHLFHRWRRHRVPGSCPLTVASAGKSTLPTSRGGSLLLEDVHRTRRQDASCRLEWCSSARSSALCPDSAAFPAPNDPRPQPEMSTSVAVRPSRFTDLGTKTFCSPLVQHGNVFLPIARIFSNSYLSRAQRSCKREGGRWRARRRSL